MVLSKHAMCCHFFFLAKETKKPRTTNWGGGGFSIKQQNVIKGGMGAELSNLLEDSCVAT